MPDIVALRARAIALADRKATLARCLLELRAVEFPLTDAMVSALVSDYDEERNSSTELDETNALPRGAMHSILGDPGLFAVSGTGWFSRSSEHCAVSNCVYRFGELDKLAAWIPAVTAGDEPSLDGLTTFEVTALVDAYKGAVSRMTCELRDAHDVVHRIHDTRHRMPGFLRQRCTGMFGSADYDTRFAYTDGDFKTRNVTEERVPRADPNDRRGPFETVYTDHHPRLLSARYLAPVLGDDAATRVEETFAAMREAVAPRPGEPPTLQGWHGRDGRTTNDIDIDYAPGEVDVGDAPVAAPAAR